MLARARSRLPGVALHQADMRSFRLPRQFDVITCLFAAIGYFQSLDELRQTLETMAAHLHPGGLLIIEPWRSPDNWNDGVVHHVVESTERTIVRMTHSTRAGRTSRKETTYLVGEPGRGVSAYRDDHLMTLATTGEYLHALTAAGYAQAFTVPGRSESQVRVLDRAPS